MKTLNIKDKIYGEFQIDSPVIIELINSKPLQRLKGISQYGVPDEFYHLKNYSRFDHSLGVFFLLKNLCASEEEQIAGLLHDISHTAFSHIVDWVIGDGKTENHQDDKHVDFLIRSEAADILKRFHFDPKRIANHHYFPLLEQDIPDLCADRIDYSVKEFPLKIARQCIAALTVKNRKIVAKDLESASLFARNFLQRQLEHWQGFEAASRYRLFANLLRKALNLKLIDFSDFWQDDNFVLNKVKKSKDKDIQKLLSILRNKSLKKYPKSGEAVFKKFRYIDPLFLSKNKLVRLSEVNKDFKTELEEAKKNNKKGIVLPDIKNPN